ncbi:hypothetical protein [Comamonas sp. MYb69]|uniref:hypothetical protein n=1 Tax=Comamonas sp. MYb69 TaxID=1848650 RepID=UPI0030AF5982
MRSIGAGDNYPARYLPLSLWKNASLDLNPVADLVAQGRRLPSKPGEIGEAGWVVRGTQGHLVSLYPIVTPLLVAPLYLPAALYLSHRDWAPAHVDSVARIMEKLVAALVASASVMLMYLLLLRQCSDRLALGLALAYAFGTSTWVISSQALWMHGVAQLLVTCALWIATSERCTPRRAWAYGLVCGLIACNRQPDTWLALGFAAYALVWARGHYRLFLAGALPPALLTLAYNLWWVGSYMGGYYVYVVNHSTDASWLGLPEGVLALLFSPVYGLLVFSPFLLLLPLRGLAIWRESRWPLLAMVLVVAVVLQILFYAAAHWIQGISWGSRFLTDMLPILVWLLPPALLGLSGWGRRAFTLAVAAAVVAEAIGAFGYTGQAHAAYIERQGASTVAESFAAQKRAAWQLQNSPFLGRPKWVHDLGWLLQGGVEQVRLSNDDQVVVEGWALAGGHTPYDLHLLVDGQAWPAATSQFVPPKGQDTEPGRAPASRWLLTFPRGSLAVGEHAFSALVRASADTQPRVLPTAVHSLSATPQAVVMLPGTHGSIDTARVIAGDVVDVAGWALVDAQTPAQVEVLLDSGQVQASSSAFFTRPDVVQSLGTLNAAGWRLSFPVGALAAGKHRLRALVTPVSGAPTYLAASAEFEVTRPAPVAPPKGSPLSEAARYAAQMLAYRQQEGGYWLTEHTQAAVFSQPAPELNIFANAQVIDILAPVAAAAAMQPMLERTRYFLQQQIESTGLVRYHGNPALPTHGSLGCKITPDADDTALVWRLAPLDDSALQDKALATLRQFRRSDGLYQTWLARREDYECIDPGKDPNPVDIGIQINVLRWLYQVQSPAAQALCQALQQRAGDVGLWVYYRRAPAVVRWSRDGLQRSGCPLPLPEASLRTSVPGQQRWLELIDRIHRQSPAQRSQPSPAQRAADTQLLASLAADGFAALRQDPVLFYHNDLTATVSRYYWSQEMAYALWLRLYYEILGQAQTGAVRSGNEDQGGLHG